MKSLGHKAYLKEHLLGQVRSWNSFIQTKSYLKPVYKQERVEFCPLWERKARPFGLSGSLKASPWSPHNSVESPLLVCPHLSVITCLFM